MALAITLWLSNCNCLGPSARTHTRIHKRTHLEALHWLALLQNHCLLGECLHDQVGDLRGCAVLLQRGCKAGNALLDLRGARSIGHQVHFRRAASGIRCAAKCMQHWASGALLRTRSIGYQVCSQVHAAFGIRRAAEDTQHRRWVSRSEYGRLVQEALGTTRVMCEASAVFAVPLAFLGVQAVISASPVQLASDGHLIGTQLFLSS
eukprot:scaffold27617_cov19-Tisochrysis_lutea.AAC.3